MLSVTKLVYNNTVNNLNGEQSQQAIEIQITL